MKQESVEVLVHPNPCPVCLDGTLKFRKYQLGELYECSKCSSVIIVRRTKQHVCGMCGESFYSFQPAKSCPNCREERNRRLSRKRYDDNRVLKYGMAVCPTCGAVFPKRSTAQLYCSMKCKPDWVRFNGCLTFLFKHKPRRAHTRPRPKPKTKIIEMPVSDIRKKLGLSKGHQPTLFRVIQANNVPIVFKNGVNHVHIKEDKLSEFLSKIAKEV